MKSYILFILFLPALPFTVIAQKNDTLTIKPSDVNTGVLKPGMHRWLVYFKMGKTAAAAVTRFGAGKIDLVQYQGKRCDQCNTGMGK